MKTCFFDQTKHIFSCGVYTAASTIWETTASHWVKDVVVICLFLYKVTYGFGEKKTT